MDRKFKHMIFTLSGILFIVIVLGGCVTAPKVMIDLNLASPVKPTSVNTQYAVLQWCIESDEGKLLEINKERAKQIQFDAGTLIFLDWYEKIALKYPFLQIMEGDLFFTENVENEELVQEAIDWIERPIEIHADLDEAKSFFWAKNLEESGFPFWLEEIKGSLILPEIKYGDRGLALKRLKKYGENYRVKKIIAVAKKSAGKRQFLEAYNQLRNRANDYPTNIELLDYLDETADLLIKQKIQLIIESRLSKVENSISNFNTASEDLKTTEQLILDTELITNKFIAACEADPPLLNALQKKNRDKIEVLQKDIASSRAKLWQQEISRLAAKKYYWSAYQLFKQRIEESESFASVVKNEVNNLLWQSYVGIIPDSISHFLEVGEKEMADAERHGITLILCNMADNLLLFANKIV